MTNTEAIFNLALLGMYADGNLTETENTKIDCLMNDLGLPKDIELRAALVTTAFNRVRGANVSEQSLADFLTTEIKPALTASGDKDRALEYLRQVVTPLGVTTDENALVGMAKWML